MNCELPILLKDNKHFFLMIKQIRRIKQKKKKNESYDSCLTLYTYIHTYVCTIQKIYFCYVVYFITYSYNWLSTVNKFIHFYYKHRKRMEIRILRILIARIFLRKVFFLYTTYCKYILWVKVRRVLLPYRIYVSPMILPDPSKVYIPRVF